MSQNYVFKVIDNDDENEGYVHYIRKGKRLICTLKDFEAMHKPISFLEDLVLYLKSRNLTKISTFNPDPEKVCSHPYEITSEDDFQACAEDGLWYKSDHSQLKEEDIEHLKNKGLKTIVLSFGEEEKLNEELDSRPE